MARHAEHLKTPADGPGKLRPRLRFPQWRRACQAVSVAIVLMWPSGASAQTGQPLALFRDAEIEETILTYAAPIFAVAGLDESEVEIHLVNADIINAFVTYGNRMFLYSGLITASEDPRQLIGVIAHETGHIVAGHLARISDGYESASAVMVLSALLGASVGIIGGGEAGVAIFAAGQDLARRQFLQYNRVQESAADQAALRFLEKSGQSAEGMRGMMETLAEMELLSSTNDEASYLRTHPLSTDRVRTIEEHLARSQFTGIEVSPELQDMHLRMLAKIHGFLNPPAYTYLRYPEPEGDIYAAYAWSIAKFRERNMDEALSLIDSLIADEPENPWFHELRGQMLFETGSIEESIPSWRRAVEIRPDAALLRIGLASALLETDNAALIDEALSHLVRARFRESTYAVVWYLLGEAYAKSGNLPKSDTARAEMHLLRGEYNQALLLAQRALGGLAEETPDWFRAKDIVLLIKGPEESEN